MTFQDNGRHQGSQESAHDLVEYLGPIEENPQPQPEHSGFEGKILCEQTQPKQVNDWPSVRQLQDELKTLQTQLGESRQRVTQLEELVVSLRTINDAQEKTVRLAGQENTDLQHRLNVVSAELVEQFETVRRLRIELDAAQQVPADSPELRQLRADLAEVIRERDTYRDGYDRVLSDLRTIRETAKAEAIEAIVEWLVPIRTCGSQALATAVISNLPHIMRSLTGLEDEGIE